MEENKKDVLPLEGEPLTTSQISEPVVNALAAALSKIETYVPTQYINDGPPDIDAEHLNHAEQAIMRVTNLANGAADAISALQSQVTQLNSDLRNIDAVVKGSLLDYAKNVNTFENVNTGAPTTDIPDNARYCMAHIMCRANSWFISVEGRDNRLYMNYNNGTDWTGWNSTALKSDLHMTSESKRITINSKQYNIKIDKIGNLLCVCNITLNTVTFNGSAFDVYTDPFDVSFRPKSTCVSPLSINGGEAMMEVMMLPDGRINLWNPNYKGNATIPVRGTLIWTV